LLLPQQRDIVEKVLDFRGFGSLLSSIISLILGER
jgi:hypothetical protein